MKKLLIAALLPLFFFSCDKNENTNIGFREPTCADTTDEGIFEDFTSAEKAQFLLTDTAIVIPNMELDSVVNSKYISGRILRNNEIFYEPYLVYKLHRPANFHMYMPTKEAQEQYFSWFMPWQQASGQDSVKINIYNVRQMQLEPGCYRLYYVFTDTGAIRTVLTKGHYDIEIR